LFEEGYSALGTVLMALDDAEGAVEAYRSAVRLDRESAANFLNLATAYGRLGMTELEAEAMAEYRRLIEGR
jgi:cytochrome c-type biogenesis protein CcmH/NrfG